jgi:hypothetical protein
MVYHVELHFRSHQFLQNFNKKASIFIEICPRAPTILMKGFKRALEQRTSRTQV